MYQPFDKFRHSCGRRSHSRNFILLYLVTFGHVWSRLVTFGHVRSRLVTFGHVWPRLVTFGHIWHRIIKVICLSVK